MNILIPRLGITVFPEHTLAETYLGVRYCLVRTTQEFGDTGHRNAYFHQQADSERLFPHLAYIEQPFRETVIDIVNLRLEFFPLVFIQTKVILRGVDDMRNELVYLTLLYLLFLGRSTLRLYAAFFPRGLQ